MEKLQIALWFFAIVGFLAGIAALVFTIIHSESDSPHDGHAGIQGQGGVGATGPSGDPVGHLKEYIAKGTFNDPSTTSGTVTFVSEQINTTSARITWTMDFPQLEIGTPAFDILTFTFADDLPSYIFTTKPDIFINGNGILTLEDSGTISIYATLNIRKFTISGTEFDVSQAVGSVFSSGVYMLQG